MKQKLWILLMLCFVVTGKANASWFGGRPTTFADLAERVSPAVVNISTTKTIKSTPFQIPHSPFGGIDPFEEFRRFFEEAVPREQKQHSLGTGFIINQNGDILTNNHVVGDADEIVVNLADGRKLKAEVVGRDETTDLAVITIKTDTSLPYANLGDSDKARPGDWVMAVGNPFGFEHTVTVGVISAKGRLIGDARAPQARFIQTDASINPGNSGGPLFDLNGEVIGINTMIYGMGTGIGFAIPINLAKSLVPQLLEKGKVTRGWLGVQIQRLTPELAKSYGLEKEAGALIGNVFPGSPAEAAGMKRGDIVLTYDGKKIEDPFDLSTYVGQTEVGKKVNVEILRQGKQPMNLTLQIGQREEEAMTSAPTNTHNGKADILGLAVRELSGQETNQYSGKGVLITRVEPASNAEEQDIRAGDILLEVNEMSIGNVAAYQKAVQGIQKGNIVRLLIGRGNTTIFIAFMVSGG